MKKYTLLDYTDAKSKLPKPVVDFLSSTALSDLYIGIGKKLGLNLRQVGTVSRIVNETLMGLEPEHGLEHTLHQELPELSNEKTRELVADINDRIFKETQRRIRENIEEIASTWDEEVLGPKDSYAIPVPDGELDKRVKAEEAAGGFKEPLAPLSSAEDDPYVDDTLDLLSIPEEDLEKLTDEQLKAKYGPSAGLRDYGGDEPVRPKTPVPVSVEAGPSFARRASLPEEKLSTATASSSQITAVPIVDSTVRTSAPVPASAPTSPVPTATNVPKADPYREPVE